MAGFMTGFAGRLSEIIRDRKNYIRERVDERRDYLRQQGLQRKAEVMEARQNLKSASDILVSRGMDRGRVATMLQESPTALTNLARQVQNDPSIDGTKLNTVLDVRDSYDPGLTLDEYIEKVTPVFTELPAEATPEQVEGFSISRLLGLDTETALQEEVYSAPLLDTTGAQIEASLTQPLYRGTGPGQYDFSQLKGLSASDISLVATQAEEVIQNQVLSPLLKRSTELQKLDTELTEEQQEEYRRIKQAIESEGALAVETAVELGLMPATAQSQLAELYEAAPQAFITFGDQAWNKKFILGQESEDQVPQKTGEDVVEPLTEEEVPEEKVETPGEISPYADDEAAEILGVDPVDNSTLATEDWTSAKQKGQIAAKIDEIRRQILEGDFGEVDKLKETPLLGDIVEYFSGPAPEGSEKRFNAERWIYQNTDKLITLFQNEPESFAAFQNDPTSFVENYIKQLSK